MKKIYFLLFLMSIILLITSCEEMFGDFLEKAPGVDVTEDVIFSSKQQVETYVDNAYYWGIHTDMAMYDYNIRDRKDCPISAACEEAEAVAPWFWVHRVWTNGAMSSINSTDPRDNADTRWVTRWKAIRICNILLERIGEVPTSAAYIMQVEGEARFIRALNYFEMFKHYGGVPIVDHRLVEGEDMKIGRATLQQTLDFILADCEIAISQLPEKYDPQYRGRATKLAALALKSKALLFAASPQFNTASPILGLAGHNDLICFGSYDKNRWKYAADAAKAAIDAASAAGCILITDQGVDKNYKYVWSHFDNSEIILAEKVFQRYSYRFFLPPSFGGFGITATFNFQKYYEKKDGTPQTWNMNGGNDLNKKYDELDPRFKQTIAYNGSYWNAKHPKIETTTEPVGKDLAGCTGGAWVRKPIPDDADLTVTQSPYANWTVFRLAELYLNYAEALNEYYDTPPTDAYNAVHVIRSRSGMPDFPAGLTQDEFRQKLRNERAIELAYDAHRIFDERRWLISDKEGLMKGNMWGIKIYAISGSTEFRYEPYVFTVRTFYKRMYLHPFLQTEVDKGYLIQNPGY